MKNTHFVIILILVGNLARAQQKVKLSALPLKFYRQEILQPTANKSMLGEVISVAGTRYSEGISVHAPFSAFIYLGKRAVSLTGSVGVNDFAEKRGIKIGLDSFARTDGYKTFFYTNEKNSARQLWGVGYSSNKIAQGSIELVIFGDGKRLWSSGLMRQNQLPKRLNINLAGVEKLKLEVRDGGDGMSGDVADLIDFTVQTHAPNLVGFIEEGATSIQPNNNKLNKAVAFALKKLELKEPIASHTDWLITTPSQKANVSRLKNNSLVLSNGLVSRVINMENNAATISIKNLVTDEEYIRAVQPEARITLDGQLFDVGGLAGQRDKGYLNTDWLAEMYAQPGAFKISDIDISDIKPDIAWKKTRWLPKTNWTASGKEVVLHFESELKKGVVVYVHYKIYDGIPLILKKLSVKNESEYPIIINNFKSEIIAYPEVTNSASNGYTGKRPNFYLENSYAFGGMSYAESNQSLAWLTDSTYTSQVNYLMQTICKVESAPKIGPNFNLEKNGKFETFETCFLALDGTEQERNTLAQRKMYRLLAPWAMQNPIFMHLTSTKPEVVKEAVDQCVQTGYEMIILSFGSGLNMEDTSKVNLEKFKALANYAHSKGIQIGGYSLFSSRSINAQTDVIDIKTGKPGGANFGNAPCMGSQWGINYLKTIGRFIEYTGFDLLEHDGPYPGDFCASTTHPGHVGYHDSQWKQWKQTTRFYQSLTKAGVYLNIPDCYFLTGSTKTGLGYREVNWSLPRAQQIILGRQNIYDGIWTKTPSMGWTFVPLVEYQGGGAAATLEPLAQHLQEYEAHMEQNYGAGVQACYRGNRLYDTEETKQLVQKQIKIYKQHRDILNADIIHLKRPTGNDWDGWMHVDPQLNEKAYAILFNPLSQPITRRIRLPFYYTGLKDKVNLKIGNQASKVYQLNASKDLWLDVTIPANSNLKLIAVQN